MKIINLTPHNVVLENEHQKTEFKKSGTVLRVRTEIIQMEEIAGFRVVKSSNHQLEFSGEEPFRPNTRNVYIVSGIVLNAIKSGMVTLPTGMKPEQFVAPDTNGEGVVRNEFGHILSVMGFIQ